MSPHARGQHRICAYYTEKSVLFTRGYDTMSEISERPYWGQNWTLCLRKSLKTCYVPAPVIVPDFIALCQTMYEKSVTKTHWAELSVTEKNDVFACHAATKWWLQVTTTEHTKPESTFPTAVCKKEELLHVYEWVHISCPICHSTVLIVFSLTLLTMVVDPMLSSALQVV